MSRLSFPSSPPPPIGAHAQGTHTHQITASIIGFRLPPHNASLAQPTSSSGTTAPLFSNYARHSSYCGIAASTQGLVRRGVRTRLAARFKLGYEHTHAGTAPQGDDRTAPEFPPEYKAVVCLLTSPRVCVNLPTARASSDPESAPSETVQQARSATACKNCIVKRGMIQVPPKPSSTKGLVLHFVVVVPLQVSFLRVSLHVSAFHRSGACKHGQLWQSKIPSLLLVNLPITPEQARAIQASMLSSTKSSDQQLAPSLIQHAAAAVEKTLEEVDTPGGLEEEDDAESVATDATGDAVTSDAEDIELESAYHFMDLPRRGNMKAGIDWQAVLHVFYELPQVAPKLGDMVFYFRDALGLTVVSNQILVLVLDTVKYLHICLRAPNNDAICISLVVCMQKMCIPNKEGQQFVAPKQPPPPSGHKRWAARGVKNHERSCRAQPEKQAEQARGAEFGERLLQLLLQQVEQQPNPDTLLLLMRIYLETLMMDDIQVEYHPESSQPMVTTPFEQFSRDSS
ncbi:hypothetical protein OE88DRAFT_1642917 [Heliocybe sulcata]|uniref:Uncharacterized protein n=1 Tax=Heliocybe sulcata TaxID=5364 RepID=A0A5C3NBI7_9AGAM|nr:hypothetical protein OE88DRAFT_1642917 [Heliocybe sulcata]